MSHGIAESATAEMNMGLDGYYGCYYMAQHVYSAIDDRLGRYRSTVFIGMHFSRPTSELRQHSTAGSTLAPKATASIQTMARSSLEARLITIPRRSYCSLQEGHQEAV